jgi:hypothetical protein
LSRVHFFLLADEDEQKAVVGMSAIEASNGTESAGEATNASGRVGNARQEEFLAWFKGQGGKLCPSFLYAQGKHRQGKWLSGF